MTQTKHDTNFLNLFDGKSFDGWKMAEKGNFNIHQEENALQTEGGSTVVLQKEIQKEIQRHCSGTRMESI
jgi:hypothetical protein